MKGHVTWKKSAERQLAAYYIDATNKAEFTRIVNEIDRELVGDPLGAGEPIFGMHRVYVRGPVAVVYRVAISVKHPGDLDVRVIQVSYSA